MNTTLSVTPIAEHPERGFTSPFRADPYTERFRTLQSILARNLSRTLVGNRLCDGFFDSGLGLLDIEVTDEVAAAMEKFVPAMKEYLTLSGIPVRGDWLNHALLLSQECTLQRSWLTDRHWILYKMFRLLRDPLPGYAEASLVKYLSEPYAMLSRAFECSKFSEREMNKYLRRLRSVAFNPGYIEKLSLFRELTILEEIREEFDRMELKLLALCILE